MAGWPELRIDLLRLEQERPSVLVEYPDPRSAASPKPYGIALAADAEAVADYLHTKYGGAVELRVGALPYPPGRAGDHRRASGRSVDEVLRPEQVRVELDGPLSVQSGADARHALRITNLTRAPLTIRTSGHIDAEVVDPETGALVGGSTKPTHAVLITFTAAPGETIRVPLFVGTESFDPTLGYAVPPGQWALRATLQVGAAEPGGKDGRTVHSPLLPLTITVDG